MPGVENVPMPLQLNLMIISNPSIGPPRCGSVEFNNLNGSGNKRETPLPRQITGASRNDERNEPEECVKVDDITRKQAILDSEIKIMVPDSSTHLWWRA
jgi:hypothetical protein